MYWRLFLAFFPRYYAWLILAAVIVSGVGPNGYLFSRLIINLMVMCVGAKLAIVLHELGHGLMTKALGGNLHRVVFGAGHDIIKKDHGSTRWVVKSKLNSGSVAMNFEDKQNVRWKTFLAILAGPGINLVFAGILYALFDFHLYHLGTSVSIIESLVLVNVLIGLYNLIPMHAQVAGFSKANDGLLLYKALTQSSFVDEFDTIENQIKAYHHYEDEEYREALAIWDSMKTVKPEEKPMILFNKSAAYLKMGKLDKATEILEEIEQEYFKTEEANTLINFSLANNLAWCYLLEGYSEKAEVYAKLAMKDGKHSDYVRGTSGAVLVALGRWKKALEMLEPLVDFNFPNSVTLCASINLALVYKKLGDDRKAERHRDFVLSNKDKLGKDELLLYHQVFARLEDEHK